jgi:hypothetical protein
MALMKTQPASISSMNRSCSAASFVQAEAPRPKVVSLAVAIASSMFFTRKSIATGPNTSSLYAGEFLGMLASTVGS